MEYTKYLFDIAIKCYNRWFIYYIYDIKIGPAKLLYFTSRQNADGRTNREKPSQPSANK